MNWLFLIMALTPGGDSPWRAFTPLNPPAVPLQQAPHPIDAFLLQTLAQKKLTPSPKAAKEILLRRLSYDLIGLPPSPEELQNFLADKTPTAWEKQIDRLLHSPRYGERMARFWMDAVHFAETHGHDQDRVRPNAWPYRDYLIQAFNNDTPYATFIEEQIAADVLTGKDSGKIAALGFLAAGPWDESSLRDIREDSIDREMGRYLDRDDILATVMGTFQGVTIQCARCHDHKFDPVSQEEYYSLQAVFSGIGRGEKEFDFDPATARRRKALQTYLTLIEKKDPTLSIELASPRFRQEVLQWEKTLGESRWVPISPTGVTSEKGSQLVRKGDSIFASGTRPDKDTYLISFESKLPITAVRLSLLADSNLPKGGPGRQDNGNLHLSEFSLSAKTKEGVPQAYSLQSPLSDYDQPGWTVLHALDGNPATAWGIYPKVNQDHEAIFLLKNPPKGEESRHWVVKLDQLHGGGHLIGRFQLFLTTGAAHSLSPISPQVQTALAIPFEKRTANDWETIGLFYLMEKSRKELDALPKREKVYAGVPDFLTDGSHKPMEKPRLVHFLKRGDIRKPTKTAAPASLNLVKSGATFKLSNESNDAERRIAMAQWLASKENPLTWRTAANRLWQFHFGKAFNDAPNDMGLMGSNPSHPELLDWLACRLRDSGSLKELHRLICTSSAYQQTSQTHEGNSSKDPGNQYLWRANRQRLDAEQIRDAILLSSGRLDSRMGGPSDQQFLLGPGKHVTPVVDYGKFSWDQTQGHRRSVYRFQFRTLPDPLVECLDGPDGSQLTPVRNQSFTSLQALALWNDDFILAHARAMADATWHFSTENFLNQSCMWLWGRTPSPEEAAWLTRLAQGQSRPQVLRVLFNSNPFLFVD